MPLHYKDGIRKEHVHCRTEVLRPISTDLKHSTCWIRSLMPHLILASHYQAGLFDVSHMIGVSISGPKR